jgi:hypothetical protein
MVTSSHRHKDKRARKGTLSHLGMSISGQRQEPIKLLVGFRHRVLSCSTSKDLRIFDTSLLFQRIVACVSRGVQRYAGSLLDHPARGAESLKDQRSAHTVMLLATRVLLPLHHHVH